MIIYLLVKPISIWSPMQWPWGFSPELNQLSWLGFLYYCRTCLFAAHNNGEGNCLCVFIVLHLAYCPCLSWCKKKKKISKGTKISINTSETQSNPPKCVQNMRHTQYGKLWQQEDIDRYWIFMNRKAILSN